MRRFKPLAEKLDDKELGVGELIAHTVSYLDAAAQLAQQDKDADLLIQIYEQSLKANGILLAAMIEDEGEEIASGGTDFGFVLAPKVSEDDFEEDDE